VAPTAVVEPSVAAVSPPVGLSMRSSMRSSATLASPAFPGVTAVSVMISLSGSIATWPL
jgi:hypothetical protein